MSNSNRGLIATPALPTCFCAFAPPRNFHARREEKGSFSIDDGDRGRQKGIKQQLCTCITPYLYISLPSLHDYDVKVPDFMGYGGRTM